MRINLRPFYVALLLVAVWLACPMLCAVDAKPPAVPAANAADWQADPDASLSQVLAQASTLVHIAKAIPWLAWLSGAGLFALGICRFLPGIGGTVANTLWAIAAPRAHKDAEQARDIQAQGFQFLVKTIEQLTPGSTLADLRDKAARKMPEAVKAAVDQYLDQTPIFGSLSIETTAPAAPKA
jgi:hypothetical protein